MYWDDHHPVHLTHNFIKVIDGLWFLNFGNDWFKETFFFDQVPDVFFRQGGKLEIEVGKINPLVVGQATTFNDPANNGISFDFSNLTRLAP